MLLIKNATIITQNSKRQILRDYDVLIEKNKIAKIGRGLRAPSAETIDAHRKVVLPSFVNTHTHIAMAILRGYADDLKLKEWLEKEIWPMEAQMKKEDIYWGSMLGIAELIHSGISAFLDMYFFPEATAKAVEESGLRANISFVMLDEDLSNPKDYNFKVPEWKSERVDYSIGPHAPYSVSEKNLIYARKFSKEHNVLVHTHLSETEEEVREIKKRTGKSPVEYLRSLGLLGKNTVAAHCVHLSKNDIKLLKETQTNVSHNPTSNLKLASGISPVQQLLNSNINVSLGTDGAASNNSLSIIYEAKLAALLQKYLTNDPTALNAQKALDMATLNGAKALRFNAGSIEEGKLADLVLLDLKNSRMNPEYNLVSNIIYSSNSSCVSDLIVNGKLVMKDGKILTFDERKVVGRAQEVAENLKKRAEVKK